MPRLLTATLTLRFYDMLLKDYRMPQPHFAPREVYRIMTECWAREPSHRPRYPALGDTALWFNRGMCPKLKSFILAIFPPVCNGGFGHRIM